ncbi:MAG: GNAT family N-acetyltransferase [Saprospiraceae bacterium]|nr:GNAT family N-acetyltransferase [Saprospiraceae bacterium]
MSNIQYPISLVYPIEFGTPEYEESVALRYEVLRKPLGLEYSPEQLSTEWSDIHIAAFEPSGKMVGILLLTPLNEQEVKMRQVAVAPDQQGKGVGAALVAASEETAKSLNFKKITLHAREIAVPFYLRLGYQSLGDQFEEVGIPHFEMEKIL